MTARTMPTHPGLQKHRETRSRSIQNRIADAITDFAGSMTFVYLHIVWFALWIGLRVEDYPFGLLTMVVSLEAIFLSTFVLISQNRQDQARGHMAEVEYALVRKEKEQNEELLRLSNEILKLTKSIDELTRAHTAVR
ncbi:MAG: DUF1003 domain-containing protein [Actinomycetota bacterium]